MGLRSSLINWLTQGKGMLNSFNEAFLWGGEFTTYDNNNVNYIEKGYNLNPFVYSVVNQMAQKTASVPIYVKKIENKSNYKKLNLLRSATGRNYTLQQKVKEAILESKAFEKDYKDFPLEAIIQDIGAFQLHLRLDNGNLVTYPNNLMLQKAVTLIQKDAIDHDTDFI